jgi:hypothetical protein
MTLHELYFGIVAVLNQANVEKTFIETPPKRRREAEQKKWTGNKGQDAFTTAEVAWVNEWQKATQMTAAERRKNGAKLIYINIEKEAENQRSQVGNPEEEEDEEHKEDEEDAKRDKKRRKGENEAEDEEMQKEPPKKDQESDEELPATVLFTAWSQEVLEEWKAEILWTVKAWAEQAMGREDWKNKTPETEAERRQIAVIENFKKAKETNPRLMEEIADKFFEAKIRDAEVEIRKEQIIELCSEWLNEAWQTTAESEATNDLARWLLKGTKGKRVASEIAVTPLRAEIGQPETDIDVMVEKRKREIFDEKTKIRHEPAY